MALGAAVSKVNRIKALIMPYDRGKTSFLDRIKKKAVSRVNSISPTALPSLESSGQLKQSHTYRIR